MLKNGGVNMIDNKITKMFAAGVSLPEISAEMNLSLDQVKRLKRLYNYQEIVRPLVSPSSFNAFERLNQSVFALKPLVDSGDEKGLNEVLEQVDDKTSRTDLKRLVDSYLAKQKRISELVIQQQQRFEYIEQQEVQIKEELKCLEKQYERLREFMNLPKQYPKAIEKLLFKYVVPFREGYALRRRLDSNFNKQLKKEGVIELNDYIWLINSLESFVDMLAIRIKNGGAIEWNYQKELNRSHLFGISQDDEYKAISKYALSMDEVNVQIAEQTSYILDFEEEKKDMIRELTKIKKSNIRSWNEHAVISDSLSDRELLKHKELQDQALRWLYTQGYVACSELTLPNKKRADVIGYKNGHVIIIEVKASLEDYKRDKKWKQYLNWCDRFYFLGDIYKYDRHADTGYLEEYGNSLKESEPDCLQHKCKDYNTIHRLINRTLSKRFIYGF